MIKNILVVCQHYWPENFRITDLCQGFVERGYHVDVVCGIPNYPKGEFYKGYSYFGRRNEIHNEVKIFRTFEIPRKGNTNLRIFLNYISFPIASVFHLPRLLFKKYDKIFIYQLSPVFMGVTGILLGKIKKIEITTYILDLWPDNLYSVLSIENKIIKNLLYRTSTWLYKKSDKLIAISPEMELLIKKRTRKQKKYITTVYQYCEKLYEEKLIDGELSKKFSDYFNIVFTGNITPAQSFQTIVNAAILLKENNYDKRIHFVIVGEGMSIKDFKTEIKRNKLENMFDFEGIKPVEDMPKYFDIADLLLVTLAKSNLLKLTIPAKVTSYIASGKPILASLEGSGERLIKEINCGLVSPPEDYQKLYNNIVTLFEMKKEEREEMGKNASKYHFKYLERDKSIDKILQFIFK